MLNGFVEWDSKTDEAYRRSRLQTLTALHASVLDRFQEMQMHLSSTGRDQEFPVYLRAFVHTYEKELEPIHNLLEEQPRDEHKIEPEGDWALLVHEYHAIEEERKSYNKSLAMAGAGSTEGVQSVLKGWAKNDPAEGNTIPKKTREKVNEFQKWLNINCDKTGVRNNSRRNFVEEFSRKPMETRLMTLYMLEHGITHPDEKQRAEIKGSLGAYNPNMNKIKDNMTESRFKLWKRIAGTTYHWNRMERVIRFIQSGEKENEVRKLSDPSEKTFLDKAADNKPVKLYEDTSEVIDLVAGPAGKVKKTASGALAVVSLIKDKDLHLEKADSVILNELGMSTGKKIFDSSIDIANVITGPVSIMSKVNSTIKFGKQFKVLNNAEKTAGVLNGASIASDVAKYGDSVRKVLDLTGKIDSTSTVMNVLDKGGQYAGYAGLVLDGTMTVCKFVSLNAQQKAFAEGKNKLKNIATDKKEDGSFKHPKLADFYSKFENIQKTRFKHMKNQGIRKLTGTVFNGAGTVLTTCGLAPMGLVLNGAGAVTSIWDMWRQHQEKKETVKKTIDADTNMDQEVKKRLAVLKKKSDELKNATDNKSKALKKSIDNYLDDPDKMKHEMRLEASAKKGFVSRSSNARSITDGLAEFLYKKAFYKNVKQANGLKKAELITKEDLGEHSALSDEKKRKVIGYEKLIQSLGFGEIKRPSREDVMKNKERKPNIKLSDVQSRLSK